MNEENLSKAYRFSSTNQPAPEKKRVPKYKTRLKKFILENIDVVNEKMKDGNPAFWNIAFERAYGKEKQEIDNKLSGSIVIIPEEILEKD